MTRPTWRTVGELQALPLRPLAAHVLRHLRTHEGSLTVAEIARGIALYTNGERRVRSALWTLVRRQHAECAWYVRPMRFHAISEAP